MHAPAAVLGGGSPQEHYSNQLRHGDLVADSEQAAVVGLLQDLYERLSTDSPPDSVGLARRLFSRSKPPPPPRGLYIWGGVGRGKTWLMDLFFDSLAFEQKQRLHFHRFMRRIHHELARLKGRRDPLDIVAADFARQARVLCLDEFHVSDIGDAMLLGQLLKALFAQGVTLVATSNIPPDYLYQDGLQRVHFLPAIALLKQHTQVVNLGGSTDYRLKYLELAKVYHTPPGGRAQRLMQAEFSRLAPGKALENGRLCVEGREIPVISLADDVAWFGFEVLCGGPRSPADYIEIARCFHTVLLSDVPVMDDDQADRLRRFMHLVDEFYDRNVKLIISAAAAPEALYRGERLAFEYRRTASRLKEMQSHAYLAREHRPG